MILATTAAAAASAVDVAALMSADDDTRMSRMASAWIDLQNAVNCYIGEMCVCVSVCEWV